MVNLLFRYPDANICGYPTDSALELLAIYFNFCAQANLK